MSSATTNDDSSPPPATSTSGGAVTSADIVIIGNGIGGSQLSVKLLQYSVTYQKNFNIVVVSANNYSEVSMNMTRAVAAGPEEHNKCIHPMFQEAGIRYAVAEVTALNEKQVTLDNGQVIRFRACVVCTGQKHPIFAPAVAHRTMESRKEFIAAVHSSIRTASSIVVAGGGGVGCEVAADIQLRYKDKSVTLIHPQASVLSAMSASYSAIGTAKLESMGVKLLLGHRVKSASTGKVVLDDDSEVQCDLLLNAYPQGGNSGFMPKGQGEDGPSSVDSKGYIKVNDYFQVDTFTNVFAFGDCCNFDPIKSYIRIEDQLPTVLTNVLGLLEGLDMVKHNKGSSFQAQIVGPAIVALGHGVAGAIGIGPDWPGIWGVVNWLCPMNKWPCMPSYGPQVAELKAQMNYSYRPIGGLGVASIGRTK